MGQRVSGVLIAVVLAMPVLARATGRAGETSGLHRKLEGHQYPRWPSRLQAAAVVIVDLAVEAALADEAVAASEAAGVVATATVAIRRATTALATTVRSASRSARRFASSRPTNG